MHKASDLPHRVPQFRKVIRDTEAKIIATCHSMGAKPDEALTLLHKTSDTLLVESLTALSATAPAKVFREEVTNLINTTLWPKLIARMIPSQTPEEKQLRQHYVDYENTLVQIKEHIKHLAWQTARDHFQPMRWSMRLTDLAEGVVYTWRGAGIRITDNPDHGYRGSSTLVVTPYAEELAGLFILVRDTSREVTDHVNKLELYGRLADTAIQVHQVEPNVSLRELTLEVLAEWYDIVDGCGG